MLISASRRTDIPAFYSAWLANRIRAGFCDVPNPFNPAQISRISLEPGDVDAMVFWTRNPRPLFSFLSELDALGFRYYFQYTLMDNPRWLDPHVPPLPSALDTFRRLADRLGSERVIWRYDPILLTDATMPDFHRRVFGSIARSLRGNATRVVISFLDPYPKIRKRMQAVISDSGAQRAVDGCHPLAVELARDLACIARENELEITSCAEEPDLSACGITPGKCIDNRLLSRLFGLQIPADKDPGQRPACGCMVSRDIGMYDTCLFGCRYCYATSSFTRARSNYLRHNPHATALLG